MAATVPMLLCSVIGTNQFPAATAAIGAQIKASGTTPLALGMAAVCHHLQRQTADRTVQWPLGKQPCSICFCFGLMSLSKVWELLLFLLLNLVCSN